jgi:choice-of-anchor A domain-containing protein
MNRLICVLGFVCALSLTTLFATVEAAGSNCQTTVTTVYAGQTINSATATIYVTPDKKLIITVTGVNGWKINAYHIYVAATPPTNSAPGQFPYQQEFSTLQSSYTFTLNLVNTAFKCGDTIYIAVHNEMVLPGGGSKGGDARETGWAFGGTQFGPWGWYLTYLICCPPTGPSTTGVQTTGVQTTGVQTTGVQTTGVQTTGVQTTGVQTTAVATTAVPTTAVPTTAVPTTARPTTAVQTTGVQTTGVQTTGVQTTGVQTTGVQTTGVQTTAVATTAAPTTAAPTTAVPTTAVPTTAVPTTAVQTTGVQTTGVQTTGVQTTGVQTTGVQTTGTTGTTGNPVTPPPPPVYTDCDKHKGKFFGQVPSLFNTFVFEDFVCYNSDTEGRLASGGNADVSHYAIGCLVHPPTDGSACLAFGTYTCANASKNGEWVDNFVIGGDLKGVNVELKLGNVVVGGSLTSDTNINFNDDCTVHYGEVVKFNEWRTYLETLSTQLCERPATGVASKQYQKLTLFGTQNPDVETFNVDGSQLCSTDTTSFDIVNVNPAATVIINVRGSTLQCGNMDLGSSYNQQHIVYNFCTASSLTLFNVNWKGSILAPFADIVNPTGQLNGQVFAKSWKASGECMQQNWKPFEGCIPDACENIEPRPYCTVAQDTWSEDCTSQKRTTYFESETAGCVIENHFFECFDYKGVTVGCPANQNGVGGSWLTLNSKEAVRTFLPQQALDNLAPLNQNYLNPTQTPAGAAAGELVAFALSVGFDNCFADTLGLCSTLTDLYMCPLEGSFEGSCAAFKNLTVHQIFKIANRVVGGCLESGDEQYTVADVHQCMVMINSAFTGCEVLPENNNFNYCPCGVTECNATPYALREKEPDTLSGASAMAASALAVGAAAALVL